MKSHLGLVARPTFLQAGLGVLALLPAYTLQAQLTTTGPFGAGVVSGWRLTTGAGGGWDKNVQFLDGVGVNALSYTVRAEGARLWQGRRDRVEALVGGALVQFPQNSALDQRNYNAATSIDHSFSDLTNGQLRLGYSRAFINRSLIGVGTGPGILLPRFVAARTADVTTGFARRLSRQMTFNMTASAQDTRAEVDDFPNGRFAALTANLAKQLTVETAVGASAEYRYSRLGDFEANLPVASVNVLHVVRSGLTARGLAGAALGTGFDAPALSRLFGGATVAWRKNRGELSADLQRSVGQQFGLESSGLLVTNSASAGYTRFLKQNFTAGARAAYGSTSDPSGRTAFSATFTEAVAETRYTFLNGPSFALGAFIRNRRDLITIRSYGGTLAVDYAWSQLRRRTGAQAP